MAAVPRCGEKGMSMNASSLCWPSRYWSKWAAVFLGAIVLGMILALAFRSAPRQITANIEVMTRVGNSPKSTTRAEFYFGQTEAEIDTKKKLTAPNPRTGAGGVPVDFIFYPLDKDQKQIKPGIHVQVKWPTEQNKTITIILDSSNHTGIYNIN